ncbi:carboxylate-amine ligase [Aeromicrobium choanae]|uniref:carboxylate-amine ligase n=1 Tax=Aeromicrobium choanae TaxID=1736691 RepID=UPI0015600B3F|nr:glutamate--cysteine ligase [Aeromicrobium choanae]
MHRVGVEEELFVVDHRGRLVPEAEAVLAAHRDHDPEHPLEHELFLQQVELKTSAHAAPDALRDDLVARRVAAVDAARSIGLDLVAVPVDVLGGDDPVVTPHPRYTRIVERFGELARTTMVCGMHVHVEVGEDDAIRVIDTLRPWLPLLAALASNSPFTHGRDTRMASWRGHLRDTWPSAGVVEPFGDRRSYRLLVEQAIASGAAIDEHMVYLDARIATRYPTVEVRVADVCTEVDDALLVAELTRALVATIVTERTDPGSWRIDVLRDAGWRARRDALDGTLFDPLSGTFVPATRALDSLVTTVRAALRSAGTIDRVEAGVHRLLTYGTGAVRQRAVAGDPPDLRAVMADLARRTDPRSR